MFIDVTRTAPLVRIRLAPAVSPEITVTPVGLEALARALAAAERDRACRLLVIEAPLHGFCHGMDLKAIVDASDAERERGIDRYVDCLERLRNSSKLVVALIDGVALGAGVGLAASADLVFATERSRFGLPEIVLGLVPAIVLTTLVGRMPIQRARRLALSGASISADEAAGDGLVDRVVRDAGGLELELKRALRHVERADIDALARVKDLCRNLAAVDHDQTLYAAARCTRELLARSSVRAALRDLTESGWPGPALAAVPQAGEARS